MSLEETKRMLEAGNEPVESDAEAVGYQDPGFSAGCSNTRSA